VKQIRKRLTYANVMSSIAVFLLLGGATAFAASKIGSNQIKSNAITTGKIKKEAVTTAKIKKDAVTGAKVKESTLGTVPSATNATNAINANTVGGRTVTNVFVKIPKSTTVTVGTFGAFKIVATCNASGDFENFELDPQTSDSDIAAFGDGNEGPIFEREQGKEPNSINLNGSGIEENERGITTFSASQSGGAVVTGTLAYDDTDTFVAEPVCAIYGEVTS
jgi:hypothetical protein